MTRALHSIPLGVLAVLLLAGCKAGPDYAAPPAPASVALGKGALRSRAPSGSYLFLVRHPKFACGKHPNGVP